MELTVNPQVVAFIIEKAREFDAKVEPDDPDSGSNASDDKAIDILEDFADDPTLEELKSAIDGLNEDESRDLVAIMWTGRGDYDKEQWSEAKAQANARRTGRCAGAGRRRFRGCPGRASSCRSPVRR